MCKDYDQCDIILNLEDETGLLDSPGFLNLGNAAAP